MLGKTCVERLQRDYQALCKEPVPQIKACPLPSNLLEWHYVLEGSENTPFAGGYYHGTLIFPTEFPFKPPSIRMITPNGRFATNVRICLSISDYHPETWNPVWSVSSILLGLLSFMMDDKVIPGGNSFWINGVKRLAKASLAYNCNSENFRTLFPEYVEKYNQQKAAGQSTSDEQLQKSQSSDPETPNEGIVAIAVADLQAVNQQHVEHHPANRKRMCLCLCLNLMILVFLAVTVGLSLHRK